MESLPTSLKGLLMPPALTPQAFVAKWRTNTRKERSAAQEHFIDLCRLIGHPTPGEAATSSTYDFEAGASKQAGAVGGPMSGKKAISPGSIRASTPTSGKPISSCSNIESH
jgi:hypothetical protein